MKKIIIVFIVIVLIGAGIYLYIQNPSDTEKTPDGGQTATTSNPVTNGGQTIVTEREKIESIGKSVDGRDIMAYHFGDGEKEILFVGGIHGGYSWNTSLVAYELIDYLEENLNVIPENLQLTVIPVMNPDGLEKVVGTTSPFSVSSAPTSREKTVPGRFNSNLVDLNRNFDCEWQAGGMWQNTAVSGGTAPFSEPEALALKNYIEEVKPIAALVWYSAAGGVFSSNCKAGVLVETRAMTNLYAKASGYKAYEEFDFYEVTGDMVNWMAKKNIPAISVLLSTHSSIEWDKNRKGIEAILDYFAE